MSAANSRTDVASKGTMKSEKIESETTSAEVRVSSGSSASRQKSMVAYAMIANNRVPTAAAMGRLARFTSSSSPMDALVSMMPNRNNTMMAPM